MICVSDAAKFPMSRRGNPAFSSSSEVPKSPNPIEKLWRWLRQDVVHHHRRADAWEELKAAVKAFLDGFADGSTALLTYVGLLPD